MRKGEIACYKQFLFSQFFPQYISIVCQNAYWVSSLPNNKMLDLCIFKAFADDILKIIKTMISFFDRVENNVGKRRKCWLPAFSPFPTVFSKAFPLRVVKSLDCVVKS